MALSKTAKISIATVVVFALGSASGLITVDKIDTWYATLNKPSFNPPNWIFGPVWSTLYVMMGITLGLVWAAPVSDAIKRPAMIAFVAQFILNLAWSSVFFGLEKPLAALVIIVVMIGAIAYTIKLFLPINKAAGYLLVPYLLWVSFATLLNAAIFYLN